MFRYAEKVFRRVHKLEKEEPSVFKSISDAVSGR